MTLTKAAVVFGIVFLVIGILGFIPGITTNGVLLGIFSVNLMHNVVHIITGIIALFAAKDSKYSKLFFQVFGVIYVILALLGFFTTGGNVLGMTVNMAGNIFHLVVGLIALYLGFLFKKLSA